MQDSLSFYINSKESINIDENNSFFRQVYNVVAEIPFGKVVSYGQIAKAIGRPKASRQVGWAMRKCPNDLPWHRVVMADGSITGGECAKIRRLALIEENVIFLKDGRVDIKKCMWDGIGEKYLGRE